MNGFKEITREVIPYKDSKGNIVAYKIPNLIDPLTLEILNRYFYTVEWQDESKYTIPLANINFGDRTCYAVGNDVLTIAMLETYTPLIKIVMDRDVLPSYTYTRVYEKNTHLISHRDRSSCEISMSVNLFQEGSELEPFYISKKPLEKSLKNDITKISSWPGDAIIFTGQARSDGHYHWRDPTKSEQHLQCFFHWVYADGDFAENAYEYRNK